MPLHYEGSVFHRVLKGFMIQGGDVTNRDGTGGESIYGKSFPGNTNQISTYIYEFNNSLSKKDERFELQHDKAFLLSMANRGPNTASSQFFITTEAAPHLDGNHVVFGRIVSGQEIVKIIENSKVNDRGKPFADIRVVRCGELELKLTEPMITNILSSMKDDIEQHSDTSANDSSSKKNGKKKRKSHRSEEEKRRSKHKKHKKHKKDRSKRHRKESDNEEDNATLVPTQAPIEPPSETKTDLPLENTSTPHEEKETHSNKEQHIDQKSSDSVDPCQRRYKGRGRMKYRTPPR